MPVGRKIRVLIVDDSPLMREVISRGIGADSEIEVVAKASDPFDARDKIIEYQPDVMTCDIQMPKMDGIDFVRRLIPQYALPVILVSSLSDAVFDALNAGAVDFVAKPSVNSPQNIDSFISDLVGKIKIASKATIINGHAVVKHKDTGIYPHNVSGANSEKLIAIGASTGGVEALYNVLINLPPIVPGIVIVQHIPPVFSRMFAERLNVQTKFNVKEAQTGDYLEQGKVLIAPGNMHMSVQKIGNKYRVECFEGEKVNGHCPSVEVLFNSVAKAAGKNAIGVILTGMGSDGAKGLLEMRKKGARTIGQNEASSVVYGMPRVAYEIGAVECQVDLSKVAKEILKILKL
jgi:two-component system chemotaxis response regulator CheB